MPVRPKLRSSAGKKLRALRDSHKVTAAQLSRDLAECGVEMSRAAIAHLESGVRVDMSLSEAAAIADYFDVPVDTLTDSPTVSPVALVTARELADALLDVEQLRARLIDELLEEGASDE